MKSCSVVKTAEHAKHDETHWSRNKFSVVASRAVVRIWGWGFRRRRTVLHCTLHCFTGCVEWGRARLSASPPSCCAFLSLSPSLHPLAATPRSALHCFTGCAEWGRARLSASPPSCCASPLGQCFIFAGRCQSLLPRRLPEPRRLPQPFELPPRCSRALRAPAPAQCHGVAVSRLEGRRAGARKRGATSSLPVEFITHLLPTAASSSSHIFSQQRRRSSFPTTASSSSHIWSVCTRRG